jgi:hypothetical protein
MIGRDAADGGWAAAERQDAIAWGVKQLAVGLDFLGATCGLVHANLRPESVFVTPCDPARAHRRASCGARAGSRGAPERPRAVAWVAGAVCRRQTNDWPHLRHPGT